MNMIICSENCKHQKDGYCCLEGEMYVTNALSSPCRYYKKVKKQKGAENDKTE